MSTIYGSIYSHDSEYLDIEYLNFEYMVSRDGTDLEFIPENKVTVELCQLAIHQTYDAIKFVPEAILDEVVNEQMCWEMLCENVLLFSLVPDKFKTSQMCDYALIGSPCNISHIPEPTEWQLFYAVRHDGEGKGFSELKPEYQSRELCIAAIETDPFNLSGVRHQTFSLCLLALQKTDLVYSDIRNPLFKLLLLPVFLNTKKTRKVKLDMYFRKLIWKYL